MVSSLDRRMPAGLWLEAAMHPHVQHCNIPGLEVSSSLQCLIYRASKSAAKYYESTASSQHSSPTQKSRELRGRRCLRETDEFQKERQVAIDEGAAYLFDSARRS